MFRQSPSRNQRSKGFRIKHGLQIFLLLAICLWLLYQVKHSHDKKKAFDEDANKTHNQHHLVKLGRKDLHPQLEEKSSENEISGKEQVMEGDDEDNKEDDEEIKPEEEEEENKPVKGEKGKHDEQVEEEEEEEDDDENKPEENEEEGRGAGDDEIDEQDQEVAEEEAENAENSIDEDDKDGKEGQNGENSIDGDEKNGKEGTEEGENKEKVKETKDEGLLDDQDHDRNTQKAREVNYKGDDASSAVLRETQVVITEADSGNLGDSTEKLVKNTEKDTLDLVDKTNSTENSASSHDIPEDKMVSGAMIEGNNSSNLKTTKEKGTEGNISTNVKKTNEENRNSELQTNSTVTESDASPVVNNTSGAEEVHPSNSFVQNATHITSGSAEDTIHERATDDGSESKLLSIDQAESFNVTTELEKSISDNRISTPIENADVTKGEFSDTSNNDVTVAMEEQTLKSSSTVDEEKSSLSSTTNANVKVGTTDGTEEALSIATENAADVTQSLSKESNNLGISHEETDLGTLAESETEEMKGENVAAE